MIDIHHHCLPGVDDGPRELAEAVALCRMAAEEGIETIVATPHVLRGRWRVFSRHELESRLDLLRDKVGHSPRLLLGSEYFFSHDMADLLKEGNAIVPLAGSRYVLLELAANSVPPMFEQPLYRAQLDGWVPIIAHPERNTVFQAKPELLAALVGHGARVQLTATSLTGAFGSQARAAAETFVRRNLVHFVATDAHNTEKRPPRVREALDVLRELAGEETTQALTHANPLAVIENRGLPWEPEPLEERSGGLFTRLRSFFDRG
ncbi:MAG TPA: CpsB/CapC family capsule biosynthesis tyrosine phosphatase [Thermoanaerobaculia bacterium]|nr:CpsB/CapC family capsule biosynthesis tyrosine phosphatase [Thermoanaerobaculia bacterium]